MMPNFLLAEAAGSPFGGIVPILLMFAVVYFVLLRPMSKEEKDRKKRVAALGKGDQVVIGGGILGRISNLDDPTVAVVEIADKVKIRVLRKDLLDEASTAIKQAEEKLPKQKSTGSAQPPADSSR